MSEACERIVLPGSEVDCLPDGRTPVLLSAHAEDLIGTDAAAILRYLDSRPEVSTGDVAATLLSTEVLRREPERRLLTVLFCDFVGLHPGDSL